MSTQTRRRQTPLSVGAEIGRQLRRRRTQWIFGILLVLPLIFVAAFALDTGPRRGSSSGTRPVDLATSGSGNFTLFVLLVSGELLFYIVAALFVGDSVPAEASWSSLRYLLTAPVGRSRLLTSKLIVGLLSVAVALVVMLVWALFIGSLFYGTNELSIPGGGEMSWSMVLPRMGIAIAYIFVAVLPIAGISFLVGVGTDTPLAAVGSALIVLIVSGILDSIDALGDWRKGLPGHYSRAWYDLFTSTQPDWTSFQRGVLWSLLYAVVLFALGYWRFQRKDVLS